jgi:hypothetical protein
MPTAQSLQIRKQVLNHRNSIYIFSGRTKIEKIKIREIPFVKFFELKLGLAITVLHLKNVLLGRGPKGPGTEG